MRKTSQLLLKIYKALVWRQSKTGCLINSTASLVFKLLCINLGSITWWLCSHHGTYNNMGGGYLMWLIFGFIF